MNGKKRFAVVAAGMLLAMPAAAQADSKNTQFENPFRTGVIDNQGGWSSFGAAGVGCATYDHEVENTSAFPGTPASFGTKSLRMSSAVTSGCFSDHTFSNQTEDEAGETSATGDGLSGGTRQSTFVAEWDIFSATPTATAGAGDSIVVSPDRGDGARMSWIQMTDEADGDLRVNFYDYVEGRPGGTANLPGFGDPALVAGDLDRDQPHTIRVEMDLANGAANDVVRVFVDGTLRHTGTSWEEYFRVEEGNPTHTVDSLLFRTGGTAVPANAGMGILIDNLELRSGPVGGPAGPQGTAGDDGADGDDGANGANGANGTNGTNGAVGAAGPQGSAGSQGLPGASTPLGTAEIDPPTVGSASRVSSKRVLKVKLACPANVSLCEGWLTLRSGNKMLGRSAFLIRSGKTGTVSIKLSAATVRSIRSGKLKRANAVVFARDGGGTASEATKSVALRLAR